MIFPSFFTDKLRYSCDGVRKKRPHFGPKQVRTLRGIKPGLTLIKVDPLYREKILVISEAITIQDDEPDSKYFKYIVLAPELNKDDSAAHLTDFGVIPYHSSGKWNPTNHLLRTGERRLNDKEIEQVAIKMGVKISLLESIKVCIVCKSTFSTHNDSDKCLFCTFDEIDKEGYVSSREKAMAVAANRCGYCLFTTPQDDSEEIDNAAPDIEPDDFEPEDGWALLDWESDEWISE